MAKDDVIELEGTVVESLPDSLLAYALDNDFVGGGNLKLDSLGLLKLDGMRIAHVEHELLALHLRPVTRTYYIKVLLVTVRYADYHVIDEGA